MKGQYDLEAYREKLAAKAKDFSLPLHTTQTIIDQLTDSVQNVIDITASSPESTKRFLKSCTDPLLSPEKFNDTVVKPLTEKSTEPSSGNLKVLADDLATLRKFFVQDKAFLHKTYAREIQMVQGNSLEEKQEKFTKFVSRITHAHLEDVTKKIGSPSISK